MKPVAPLVLALALACTGRPPPGPDAGSLARYPPVPFGGGPVLERAQLVSLTLGPDALGHETFLRWLAASGWLTERTREYGVQSVAFGSAAELPAPAMTALTDADVRAALRTQALAKDALYVVWLAPGTTLVDRFGNRTCLPNPGTGYHESLDAEEVAYVAMPACAPRFGARLDQAGSMHLDAARLVVDALTNPSPRNAPAYAHSDGAAGWLALGAEVGDFCWGRLTELDGVTLQRVWSNAAVARGDEPCVPAPAGPAFGFEVAPQGRRPLAVAEKIQLTVRGWSSGAVDDWAVQVIPWSGDFTMMAELDRATLNDGVTATMTVEVPFPVASGTAGAVLLRALGPNDAPQWPVSILVR